MEKKISKRIFIGRLIEEELHRQERSVAWFARQLNYTRTNVYKIFHRSRIDTELLERISNILHRNFFEVYSSRLINDEQSDTQV